jgi:hypothetical protein
MYHHDLLGILGGVQHLAALGGEGGDRLRNLELAVACESVQVAVQLLKNIVQKVSTHPTG